MARSLAFKRELFLLKSKMGQKTNAFVHEQCLDTEQWSSDNSEESELRTCSVEKEPSKEKCKENS